jgi:pimeloyl-ACP methyl ester carboxylesterase
MSAPLGSRLLEKGGGLGQRLEVLRVVLDDEARLGVGDDLLDPRHRSQRVVAVVTRNGEWLARTPEVPKLLLTFDGKVLSNAPAVIDWATRTIPNLEVVPLGAAGHHAPEDAPREIADAISAWLDRPQR